MSRKLSNGIIESVMTLMGDTEVPEIFAVWGGIVAVSAALGRRCHIAQGHFTVFPNLYVVLVAGSAKCRKSTMINVIEDFVVGLDPPTNVMSQKCTPEALIGALSGYVAEDQTTIIKSATGIAVVDELSTLIDRNAFGSGLIAILTKLYDCKDFTYRTKSRGLETVHEPCLSLFGGSTLHWIKEAIPIASIGGGFTARMIFVYQDKKEKYVAWPVRSEDAVEMEENIMHDLNEVQKLEGEFGVTDAAIKLYSDEYETFAKTHGFFDDPNMDGYAGRRHAMVNKLAMCFSASSKDTREITELDMARAINALCHAEQSMQKVLNAINSSQAGDVSEQLVVLMSRKKRMRRRDVVRMFRSQLSVEELDSALRVLTEAGFIQTQVAGQDILYVWTGTGR